MLASLLPSPSRKAASGTSPFIYRSLIKRAKGLITSFELDDLLRQKLVEAIGVELRADAGSLATMQTALEEGL